MKLYYIGLKHLYNFHFGVENNFPENTLDFTENFSLEVFQYPIHLHKLICE